MTVGLDQKKNIVDYIFWFTLILFTNPGGSLGAMGLESSGGGIHFTDILFFILLICWSTIHRNDVIFTDKNLAILVKCLFIFLLYYLFVFGFFIPLFKNSSGYSVLTTLIKIRHGIYNFFLVLMVYQFYLRSHLLFYKVFLSTSIVVLGLFLFSFVTGIEILPMESIARGFVDTDRVVMQGRALMPILIPMGIVVLVFNFKIPFKKMILIGAFLMYLYWILSIVRREIFGAIILFFLVSISRNYLMKRPLIPFKKIGTSLIYVSLIIFFLKFAFPQYLNAVIVSAEETYHVFMYGETTAGRQDTRLGFGKDFMQNTISDHYLVGTGFDNRWRTGEGDQQGFEAADYPFLAAIAMTGVLGLLFFLPVYLILIKVLSYDIRYLRASKMDLSNFDLYILLVFISVYIFEFLQYMNWFLPLSLFTQSQHKRWYIFLAIYFAARKIYYIKQTNNSPNNNGLENSSLKM